MPVTDTPLRYPGGKTSLYPYVKALIESNGLYGCTYVEPFAGGAGLALKLLKCGDVRHIVINDFDRCIYVFWKAVVEQSQELCRMVEDTPVTIEEWKRQKSIYLDEGVDDLHLAFATLFLNRTNIGGIIKGGVIGGLSQSGKYRLDARFNKQTTIRKIKKISSFKDSITVLHKDAKELLLSGYLNRFENVFLNIDPPYVLKGGGLYKNFFTKSDHEDLCLAISSLSYPWIVTYDIGEFIKELYAAFRHDIIPMRYSINKNSSSKEYMFFSNGLSFEGIKL
ncbi:MAG: DNA adenine methylase [Bacteroidales bacterium]|nr:DNA adenine methylase [Bacteroidales bacterium]